MAAIHGRYWKGSHFSMQPSMSLSRTHSKLYFLSRSLADQSQRSPTLASLYLYRALYGTRFKVLRFKNWNIDWIRVQCMRNTSEILLIYVECTWNTCRIAIQEYESLIKSLLKLLRVSTPSSKKKYGALQFFCTSETLKRRDIGTKSKK